MGISETPNCLFCKIETEAIAHNCTKCDNVNNLWKVTEDWARMIYDAHFKISDIEKIFGEYKNSPVKELIILSVKDIIARVVSRQKAGSE